MKNGLMRRRTGGGALLVLLGAAIVGAQGAPDTERVAKNKQAILSKVERPAPETRGDKPGQIRLKWEWYLKVVSSYRYEKQALVTQASAGEKHDVRPQWVFKDMKVTFGELFRGKEGKLQAATMNAGLGWAFDAVTVRWRDVKDKVVDEVSEAKLLEDLKLERDALFPEGTATN
jgi:hypothetical protein